MSAKTFCSYYPERFTGARFFDAEKRDKTFVPVRDNDDDDDGPDAGTHNAAATADTKKRRREDDGDDNDEETKSKKALRKIEKDSEPRRYSQRDVVRLLKSTSARVLRSPPIVVQDDRLTHTSHERTWRIDQAAVIETIATQVPMIAACVSTLKKKVMSDGLMCMRENVELVPSNDFQKFIVERLHPFAYQCIDAFLKWGLIPILYELDPRTGQRWPYVPADGTFVIKRHTVFGKVVLRYYWIDEASYHAAWRRQAIKVRDVDGFRWTGRMVCQPYPNQTEFDESGGIFDPTVEIIHNLGHELTSRGEFTSKIGSLMMMAYNRMRVQRARTIAESNAAAPPLVTMYDHATEAHQSKNIQSGHFASAAGAPQHEDIDDPQQIENRTYMRDTVQREAFLGLLRYYEDASGRDAGQIFDVPQDQYRADLGGTAVTQAGAVTTEGVPAPWANQYHVQSSRKLGPSPQAHASTDYVDVLTYMDQEICAVLGVPQTYINGSSVKAGSDLITNRLDDEVLSLKSMIGDVMTHVYNSLFLGEDISAYMASEYRARQLRVGVPSTERRMPGPLLTEDDLYVVDAIKRVRMTFSKSPSENPEELFQMFALGGMEQSVLCAELARRNQFLPSQLSAIDKEKEIPLEMRHFLIPQFADYYKFQFEQTKHKDDVKLQKEQNEQQDGLKRDEMKSKEKLAKTTADAKAKAAAAPKPAVAAKPAAAPTPKPAAPKVPSLTAISKAASVLAKAGAALKKQKDEEKSSGGEKKKS